MTTRRLETFPYCRHGDTELTLDVFRAETNQQRSAVIIFHGGGWRQGSTASVHTRAAALADHGFTAIAVQYRLLDAAPWPAQLDDAAAALAWVRDRAQTLGVDPDNTIAQGHSAGALMALLIGSQTPPDQRPAAVVAYYPPIGFYDAPPPGPPEASDPPLPPTLELDETGRVPSWMLFPPGAPQSDLQAASPIDLVGRSFPPTIILHGTADSAINHRASLALHARLLDLGVPTDLHLYAERQHEFDRAPSMAETTAATVTTFARRYVTNTEQMTAEANQYAFSPTTDTHRGV